MARIHVVKKARRRYKRVPVLDSDGNQVIVPRMRKDGTPKTTKKGKEVVVRLTKDDTDNPLPNIKCGKCGVEIEPGMSYKWVQPKTSVYGGAKRYRCMACPNWRQSELTSSKMSGVYAAQEQLQDQIGDCCSVEDLEGLRDDIADQIEAVGDEYEEGAQNIEDGFGHETMQSEEMKEKAEQLKDWADEIRNVSFEEFDGEEDPADEDDEDLDEDVHWEEQQQLLDDIVGDCPV